MSEQTEPREQGDATYDVDAVQAKWLQRWNELDPFAVIDDGAANALPAGYVSARGDLHMGHAEAWAIADVIARWWVQQGYDVLHPVGVGLLRAACGERRHQAQREPGDLDCRQHPDAGGVVRRYGISFDWSTRLHPMTRATTSGRWLFLAVRARSGLSQGQCRQLVSQRPDCAGQRAGHRWPCEAVWRRGHETQPDAVVFRTTAFADRLLTDMTALGKWPEDPGDATQLDRPVEGAFIDFPIEGTDQWSLFSARPDTMFGATFFVVAPDAPLAAELCSDQQRDDFEAYREQVLRTTEIERLTEGGTRRVCSWASTRATWPTVS